MAITKYKNFLDYDEDYEFTTKIKSNKTKNYNEDERFEPKKQKQKKFNRISHSSLYESYDD